MASAFNAQSDPGVVFKFFSASQQSIGEMYQLVSFSHLLAVALGQRPLYPHPYHFAKRQNDCPTDGATKLKPLTNNFVISSR